MTVKKKRAEKQQDRTSVPDRMNARELQERADHYRRVASLVNDEDVVKALLELAEHYEALARALPQEAPAARPNRSQPG
jgi:hypothetical protein